MGTVRGRQQCGGRKTPNVASSLLLLHTPLCLVRDARRYFRLFSCHLVCWRKQLVISAHHTDRCEGERGVWPTGENLVHAS